MEKIVMEPPKTSPSPILFVLPDPLGVSIPCGRCRKQPAQGKRGEIRDPRHSHTSPAAVLGWMERRNIFQEFLHENAPTGAEG